MFAGVVAKNDDNKFVEYFKKNGTLVAETKLEHDYAHCWRCYNPVIYRATKQWFFKVEDLKEETPEEHRDKLEQLEGDERLPIGAIKGWDELVKRVERALRSIPRGGGTSAMGVAQAFKYIAHTEKTCRKHRWFK